MNLRRTALALLVASLTSAAVLFWTARPQWSLPLADGSTPLGFAGDAVLIADAEGHLSRHDLRTGRLLSRVRLDTGDPWPEGSSVTASPDGRRAVLIRHFDFHWALVDATNGVRLTPFHPLNMGLDFAKFAPDSRWFAITTHAGVNNQITYRHTIHDARTGEQVFAFGPHPTAGEPSRLEFRDDGGAVAIAWNQNNPPAMLLELIDLPGGQDAQRIALPPSHWATIEHWSGSRLRLTTLPVQTESSTNRFDYWRFDLTTPVARERIASRPTEAEWVMESFGADWALELNLQPCCWTPFDPALSWIAQRVGVTFPEREGYAGRYRFLDPNTLTVHAELPTALPPQHHIRPDGRWMTAFGKERGLEVWPIVAPWPRWPWALVVGLSSAGGIVFTGRRRAKR